MSHCLLVLYGRASRDRACRLIEQAPEGTRLEVKGPRRSLPQNDKLWALLTDVSCQVDWYGQKLTAEDWKDVFTASLRKARVVPGLDAGSFVPLGMRTSDMSKSEFSDLLELIHAFAAERGVTFGNAGDLAKAEAA